MLARDNFIFALEHFYHCAIPFYEKIISHVLCQISLVTQTAIKVKFKDLTL